MYSKTQGNYEKLDFNANLVLIDTLNGCFPLAVIRAKGSGILGYGKSKLLIHPKE